MAHLIDKDALVAEIERRKKEWSYGSSTEAKYKVEAYKELIEWIDTIEAKEEDFDTEWKRYFEHRGEMATVNTKHLAKHFFKLGLQVNNPITAADRGIAYEIILALKEFGEEKMISYDKEIEWVRNKSQKEE